MNLRRGTKQKGMLRGGTTRRSSCDHEALGEQLFFESGFIQDGLDVVATYSIVERPQSWFD